MNKKKIKTKELKRREYKALMLYGSGDWKAIEKNHRRIKWLRKYLKARTEPRRMSVAGFLLSKYLKK